MLRAALPIGILLAAACGAENIYKFSEIPLTDTNPGNLRKHIKAIEYTKHHGSKILFNGEKNNPPDATYEVDSSSDIVISFLPSIRNLSGNVSVRARLLRNPVVELPVQNFTTVTAKDLKKESVLLLPAESSMFRDDKYHKEVQIQLATAQSSHAHFGGYIDSHMLSLLAPFTPKPSNFHWSDKFEINEILDDRDYTTLIANLIEGLKATETLRVTSYNSLVHLRDTIRDLFLDGEFIIDINSASFSSVKQIAQTQMKTIEQHLVELDDDYNQYIKPLAQCSSNPNLAYIVTAPNAPIYASAQDIGVTGRSFATLPKGEKFYATKDGKALKIIYPKDREDAVVDEKTAMPIGRQIGVLLCARHALSGLFHKLDADRMAAEKIQKALTPSQTSRVPKECRRSIPDPSGAASSDPAKQADMPAGANQAPAGDPLSSADLGISEEIERMECIVQTDISDNLAKRIHDARIKLSESELTHGDVITVSVAITIPALVFSRAAPGSTPEPTIIEEKFTIRVIDRGWSFSTRPQFALIKRQSDVMVGTAKDSPSNFKPAAGVLLNFRYRVNRRLGDWAIPSIGIGAFAVDFDPGKTFELGVGPSLGLLNDFIHLGAGTDLSVDKHHLYGFVSLDFLRTFDTFSTIFGGGGK